MAVIQISKIQVRRGLQENLPQLASGEMGWSIDERRLWIGNGTLTEGAPEVGNTEILTANGDVLQAITSYRFRGDESGYDSVTGVDSSSPTYRTLQHKVDEQISVRDFGAVGDGVTDDTLAVQRAFNEIYPTSYYNNLPVRRVIHFPAGTYVLYAPVYVPSYAKIVGDGMDSTVIRQDDANYSVFEFRDSLGQTGGSYGTNGATLPKYIEMSNMTLQNENDWYIIKVDSSYKTNFHKVKFLGSIDNPNSTGTSKSAALVASTVGQNTGTTFTQCVFKNITYGIYATGDIEHLTVASCEFDTLYQGLVATTDGADVPVAVRIKDSLFDNIYSRGLNVNSGASIVSAFNYFKNVGNSNFIGTNTPTDHVIYYEGPNNYSFGDSFDRSDYNTTNGNLRIFTAASTSQVDYTLTALGTLKNTPGVGNVLVDNTSGSTGLILVTNVTSAIIDYSINRSTTYRMGTIKYTQNSGTVVFDDEYSETGDTGTTLGFTNVSGNVHMTYTTTSTGSAASLNYQIRRFTSA